MIIYCNSYSGKGFFKVKRTCWLCRYVIETKEDKLNNAKEKTKDDTEEEKKTLRGKIIARLQVICYS